MMHSWNSDLPDYLTIQCVERQVAKLKLSARPDTEHMMLDLTFAP